MSVNTTNNAGQIAGKKFDIKAFNSAVDIYEEKQKSNIKQKEQDRLNELNKQQVSTKQIYQLTLFEILVEIKNAWFGLLDDLLEQRFTKNILIKNNRMFFIGITFIVIAIILYFYNVLTEDDKIVPSKLPPREIHHIYYMKNNNMKKLGFLDGDIGDDMDNDVSADVGKDNGNENDGDIDINEIADKINN